MAHFESGKAVMWYVGMDDRTDCTNASVPAWEASPNFVNQDLLCCLSKKSNM